MKKIDVKLQNGYESFRFRDLQKNYKKAILILDNGYVFYGYNYGSNKLGIGEICFNTSMTGYQEIITDPSYSKQIINFTFPHVGNIGTNVTDLEAKKSFASGIVTRQLPTNSSNWRSTMEFNDWLVYHNLPAIAGIDTRFLTKIIRKYDSTNALISPPIKNEKDLTHLKTILTEHPSMKGLELSHEITTKNKYNWKEGLHRLLIKIDNKPKKISEQLTIVAIDFGIKNNILRCLYEQNFNVIVLPQSTNLENILKYRPSGVFLSNGPGDPQATNKNVIKMIKNLTKIKIPIFGICIGHQLLALSLGAKTIKMRQGHRGANHPVKNYQNNSVEITSQNHGFEVEKETLPENLKITHKSLFDNSIEGIKHSSLPIFSVQFHPEASPGPTDTSYLFKEFYMNTLRYYNAKKN